MTGKIPPYVPPHLRGKVGDFRQEADGGVSFAHDEAALGLGPEESRQRITQDQYKQTFDAGYRRRHMVESMRGQYDTKTPTTRSRELTDLVTRKIRDGMSWGTSSNGKSVGTAGLLSALAGGAGGAYMAYRNGTSPVSSGLLMALLAGGLGAGGVAYAQNKNKRRETYLSKKASSSDIIIKAIERDHSMSRSERADSLRMVARMNNQERDALSRMLRSVVGAGAGALIARFIRSKGLMPVLAGGMIGALAGYASGPGPTYNAMGQLSLSNYR